MNAASHRNRNWFPLLESVQDTRVGRDQVEQQARRRAVPIEEIERWIRPNLDYEP